MTESYNFYSYSRIIARESRMLFMMHKMNVNEYYIMDFMGRYLSDKTMMHEKPRLSDISACNFHVIILLLYMYIQGYLIFLNFKSH